MLNTTKENFPHPQLLNVQQAAEYLGVHVGTIRRWAYAKKLKGLKIGIRGDWRFKETDLIRLVNAGTLVDSVANADQNSIVKDTGSYDLSHFVQFYEDDDFLVKAIKQFIGNGDAAVIVVTPAHKEKLEEGLELYGLDVMSASQQGHYIYLDAREALSKFMVEGMPDADLFFEVFGAVLTRASRNKKNVRVFGEMVAILWAEGNHEAAVRLEDLWNEIQKIHNFSLFCAYPIQGFGNKDHGVAFERIEKTHSHVIPSESYSSLIDEDKKLREIALLQQKAQALEAEVKEHKKTEITLLETLAALKASEEFNRRIVENSADCIKVLDLKGNLQSINQPGCRMLEIDDLNAYLGKNYRIFWKDSYLAEASKALNASANGAVGRFQGFCPTPKGTPKWWDVVITPMYDSGGKIDRLLAISRDITSIKELEQRKEDFLSATSHELKTPLTSQKAFIQLLLQLVEKNKDEKYLRYVAKINEQTDKLANLVTDLLDVSKIQGGKLVLNIKPFDMNDCVNESVDEIQTVAKKYSILVQGRIRDKVKGDKEKISQVVVNLLTNAIKYSPEGKKINVRLKKEGKFAMVSVEDFGIGIDRKDQDKVFDRFYRVDNSDEKTFPGLGMGLYIASEIIKRHKGKIWVESVKGKGSLFCFTIPLS